MTRDASQHSSTSGALPLAALRLRRALIVEDNDELRRRLAVLLSAQGWLVDTARTLGDGLVLAGRLHPQAILSELLLPDVRDYRFADAYRSVVPHRVVVLGVTRLPEALFARARELGFDDVFGKPIDVAVLATRLDTCCPPLDA